MPIEMKALSLGFGAQFQTDGGGLAHLAIGRAQHKNAGLIEHVRAYPAPSREEKRAEAGRGPAGGTLPEV